MLFRSIVLLITGICLILLSGSSIAGSPQLTYSPKCFQSYEEITSSYTIKDEEAFRTAAAFSSWAGDETKGENILAIYKASRKTGVDMDLLLLKAIIESDLGKNIVSQSSSARGIFQFVEQTWLALMHRYGEEAGFPQYAEQIHIDKKTGLFKIKGNNKKLKEEILSLRNNPLASSYLTARQIEEETSIIRSFKKSGKVTETDHYLAHLLGLRLASKFYEFLNNQPETALATTGDTSLSEAARLNRWFFYDGKRALTAAEVYSKADKRIKRELKNIAFIRQRKHEQFCIGPRLLSLASVR